MYYSYSCHRNDGRCFIRKKGGAMKKYIVFSVICAVACWSNSFAQYPDWKNYTSGQGVYALADNGNELRIGTDGGGLAKFDVSNWTVYDTTNSGLPDYRVLALAIDGSNIWIGTYGGGLAKFDGTNWTVYDTTNSGLPDNGAGTLAIDGSNIWIGSGGLTKFDGTNWIVYNESNSGLPDNGVRALAIDGSNIWIGTYYGGVAEFDGTNWTVYNTSNSDLPDNEVLALAIDGSDNIWIGSWGLAKFDGTNWTVYNESNSDLPWNRVMALAIDGSDNIWIGTYSGGLAKFDGTNWTVYYEWNSGLPDNCIRSLAIDGSNIWIGTPYGLAKFDGTNWTEYNAWNSDLPYGEVHALAIDGSDNIWIGTWLGGLAVYPASLVQYVLTISAGTGGTTNPSPGDHSYDDETQVAITAIPADIKHEFSRWTGDVSGTTNPITITMDSDKSVTATFSVKTTDDGAGAGKKDGCFIATAAYGSPLHSYVKILRDFRDTYLMPTKLGRVLIDLYYKYSPWVADVIAKHKVLRVAVRISLLPLIAFSNSMVQFGPAITVVMLVLIFALPILFIASYRKKLMRVKTIFP
jgi:hypothetical protein